jgi:hypothetical protein
VQLCQRVLERSTVTISLGVPRFAHVEHGRLAKADALALGAALFASGSEERLMEDLSWYRDGLLLLSRDLRRSRLTPADVAALPFFALLVMNTVPLTPQALRFAQELNGPLSFVATGVGWVIPSAFTEARLQRLRRARERLLRGANAGAES